MTENEVKTIALRYFEVSGAEKWNDFFKGFLCALNEIEMQNLAEADRKAGKFLINDFVRTDKDCRDFFQGVYREEGKEIVTDGKYLIVHHNNSYDPSLEGVITDINGKIKVGAKFPKWAKVVPDDIDLKPSPISLLLGDVKKITKTIKTKSTEKLTSTYIRIKDNYYKENDGSGCDFVSFNALNLKNLFKFIFVYRDAKIYAPAKDDDRHHKPWKIIDEKTGDFMIFMPCCKSSPLHYTYDTQDRIIVKNI